MPPPTASYHDRLEKDSWRRAAFNPGSETLSCFADEVVAPRAHNAAFLPPAGEPAHWEFRVVWCSPKSDSP
jgi:hypothetical protein